MIITKYSELTDRVTYDEMRKSCSLVSMRNESLRLFFISLLFLSKYAEKYDRIVYAGLGNIEHIWKLSQLFPKCEFEIWDPADIILPISPNITRFREFFTDQDAEKYKKYRKKILFISNIRDTKMSGTFGGPKKETDKVVLSDMQKQLKWCKLMKPKIALLRFRLAWEKGRKNSLHKYLTGTHYLQPYNSLTTDTMLSTSDYDSTQIYDADEYDEKMAAHNLNNVCTVPDDNIWTDYIDQYGIKNRWDNIYALYIVNMYLATKKTYPTKLRKQIIQSIELFLDIVESQNDIHETTTNVVFE